jgi:hypothetical protein
MSAGLKWLDRVEPNVDRAMEAFRRVETAAHGADAVIENIRAHFKMGVRTRTSLDIDDVIEGAHEGRLWVTADQGRGAIFHFTVPVDPGSPS